MLKGVLYSLSASIFFGLLYYYSTLLRPLSGEGIFGFRILSTLPLLFGSFYLFNQQQQLFDFIRQLRRQPKLLWAIFANAANMGLQMWLFLWAPNNGSALETSIGYLLLPITMVITGYFFMRETPSPLKLLAVIVAGLGVACNIWATGAFSWESLVVCLGYPVYVLTRKKLNINHMPSFFVELLCLTPVVGYFAYTADVAAVQAVNPHIYAMLPVLGLLSVCAFVVYIKATMILPINLLGLLGYVEPLVMLVVAFLIGERLQPDAYLLMICLMAAIFLLVLEGTLGVRKKMRSQAR